MKGLGKAVTQLPAGKRAETQAESPFAELSDAPAPAPASKKGKTGREAAKPMVPWKRPAVFVGAGAAVLTLVLLFLWASGVLRVKTKDGTIVLENLPPDAEVTVDE